MDHLEPVSCAEASRFDVRSGSDGELGWAWALCVLDPVGLWDPQRSNVRAGVELSHSK